MQKSSSRTTLLAYTHETTHQHKHYTHIHFIEYKKRADGTTLAKKKCLPYLEQTFKAIRTAQGGKDQYFYSIIILREPEAVTTTYTPFESLGIRALRPS